MKTYRTCERFYNMTADAIRAECAEMATHPGSLEGMTAAHVYCVIVRDETWECVMAVTDDEREIFPSLLAFSAAVQNDDGLWIVRDFATEDEAEEFVDRWYEHDSDAYDDYLTSLGSHIDGSESEAE